MSRPIVFIVGFGTYTRGLSVCVIGFGASITKRSVTLSRQWRQAGRPFVAISRFCRWFRHDRKRSVLLWVLLWVGPQSGLVHKRSVLLSRSTERVEDLQTTREDRARRCGGWKTVHVERAWLFCRGGETQLLWSSPRRMLRAAEAIGPMQRSPGWAGETCGGMPQKRRGERGIRTLGRGLALRRFSKALLSTTQPSLLVALCFRQLLPTKGRQRVACMPTK